MAVSMWCLSDQIKGRNRIGFAVTQKQKSLDILQRILALLDEKNGLGWGIVDAEGNLVEMVHELPQGDFMENLENAA